MAALVSPMASSLSGEERDSIVNDSVCSFLGHTLEAVKAIRKRHRQGLVSTFFKTIDTS